MRKKIFKVLIFFILLIFIVKLFSNVLFSKQSIVSKLEGKIIYIQREDSILNLYTSDANLKNRKLLYTHKGKGEQNENIIDFYYDEDEKTVYFIAMKNREWSLFCMTETGEDVKYIRKALDNEFDDKNVYLSTKFDRTEAISKSGDIYLKKDGKEEKLRGFYGIYDEKFNPGYTPIGFSPDGKYLIYNYFGKLTPLGTMIEGFFTELIGLEYHGDKNYIMNLETKDVQEYINTYGNKIQWIVK